MSKFEGLNKLGLRDKDTNRLIAVYPHKPQGTDEEIEKEVKDWYYKQSCAAEDELRNAYVDVVKSNELESNK